MGLFIRGGTAYLWGPEPTRPHSYLRAACSLYKSINNNLQVINMLYRISSNSKMAKIFITLEFIGQFLNQVSEISLLLSLPIYDVNP